MKNLQAILRLMEDSQVTVRFHSLRKMDKDVTPQGTLPWIWTISTQVNGELWHQVQSMCYHSIWQLIQVQVKPQSQGRSSLAQALAKMK